MSSLMELGTILDWKFEIRLRVSENNEIFEKWLSFKNIDSDGVGILYEKIAA